MATHTLTHLMAAPEPEAAKPIAANDHIQIGLIGAGKVRGMPRRRQRFPASRWWRRTVTTAAWITEATKLL